MDESVALSTRVALLALVFFVGAASCGSRQVSGAVDGGCDVEGTWSLEAAPTSADLFTVFEPAPDDVWIQGDRLYRRVGGAFVPQCVASFCGGSTYSVGSCGPMAPAACTDANATPITGRGLFGTNANDLWAGNGIGSIMHWGGAAWTSFFAADNRAAGTFFGTGAEDVWGTAGSSGYRGHFDGQTWTHVSSDVSFNEIWASDAAHYYGVPSVESGSSPGAVTLFAGAGEPNVIFTTTAPLFGIWGSGANDIWAVGGRGTIVHFDGNGWSAVPSPTTNDLYWAWGASASNVWAVGAGGTIVHYNGQAWSSAASPTSQDLHGVAGTCGDVWAVGSAGTVLHLR
jgi:hypothetical protein